MQYRAKVYAEKTDEEVIHQLLNQNIEDGNTEIRIAIVNTPESALLAG